MSVEARAVTRLSDAPVNGEEHRSLERLVTMFARFVGTGYAAYFLILLPEIQSTAALTPTWWNWLSGIAVFGTGLTFGLLSFSERIDLVRWAGGVAAVAYLAATFSWWLVWDGTSFDVGGHYWLRSRAWPRWPPRASGRRYSCSGTW